MKDYKILDYSTKRDLERMVKKLIKDGWEPIGGITTFNPNYPTVPSWIQAMILR